MDKLLNWFKTRGPFLATAILLIVIPLYPKFPWQLIANTWVSLRLSDFLVAGAVIIWLISQMLRKFPILKSRLFKLFSLFWLTGLLCTIAAWLITDLVDPSLMILHWARRIEYMIVFFIAYDAIKKIKDWKDLRLVILITLIAVFIYGMGQKYLSWPVISTMNEEFSKGTLLYLDQWTRISATFAGHYDLAVWLMMILSFIPSIYFTLKNKFNKFLLTIPTGLAFYLLVLTASRVSFVAYLIGISVTLFFAKKYWWIVPVILFSLLLGFSSQELNQRLVTSLKSVPAIEKQIAKIEFFWENNNPTKNISLKRNNQTTPTPMLTEEPEPTETPTETGSTTNGQPQPTTKPTEEKINREKEIRDWPTPEEAAAAAQRSSSIRFQVEWPRAKRAFFKNPLIGTGYSSLGLATDNDYLRMLGETGLIGTAAFLLILFHLFKHYWQTLINDKQKRIYTAGFLGLMLGFLANAVFIDVFEASKTAYYFWLIMGMGYKITSQKFKIKNK
jgi:hypothetical protein